MSGTLPTIAELRAFFSYDRDRGELSWIVPKGTARMGVVAGTLDSRGYRAITINRRRIWVHRLVWFIEHNEWPAMDIDHINGDKSDNRIVNLRHVSRSVNIQNLQRARSDSKTGLLGVVKRRTSDKYMASIQTEGRRKYLGTFNTPQAAHAAYLIAKRLLHPGGNL